MLASARGCTGAGGNPKTNAVTTIPSAGVFSEATKQAILDHAKAIIEELQREYAA